MKLCVLAAFRDFFRARPKGRARFVRARSRRTIPPPRHFTGMAEIRRKSARAARAIPPAVPPIESVDRAPLRRWFSRAMAPDRMRSPLPGEHRTRPLPARLADHTAFGRGDRRLGTEEFDKILDRPCRHLRAATVQRDLDRVPEQLGQASIARRLVHRPSIAPQIQHLKPRWAPRADPITLRALRTTPDATRPEEMPLASRAGFETRGGGLARGPCPQHQTATTLSDFRVTIHLRDIDRAKRTRRASTVSDLNG